jgi:hypothetical protein
MKSLDGASAKRETADDCDGHFQAAVHVEVPGLGSPRRRILGREITDCRPIKLVAAMSEQRQEPVVQKTG